MYILYNNKPITKPGLDKICFFCALTVKKATISQVETKPKPLYVKVSNKVKNHHCQKKEKLKKKFATGQTDKQTDRQTDKQTNRQTEWTPCKNNTQPLLLRIEVWVTIY